METKEYPKYTIDLKQSAKAFWYVGSVKISAETKEELEKALEEAIEIATKQIEKLNTNSK